MDIPQSVQPFVRSWAFWWFPPSGLYEEYCCEYSWTSFRLSTCVQWHWKATGVHGNARFTLLRILQTAFHSSCAILDSHQQRARVPISLHLHQRFFFFFKSQPPQRVRSGIIQTLSWPNTNTPYSSAQQTDGSMGPKDISSHRIQSPERTLVKHDHVWEHDHWFNFSHFCGLILRRSGVGWGVVTSLLIRLGLLGLYRLAGNKKKYTIICWRFVTQRIPKHMCISKFNKTER